MGIVIVLGPAAICMFGKYRLDRNIPGRHGKGITIQHNIAGHNFPFYKVTSLRRSCGQGDGPAHGCRSRGSGRSAIAAGFHGHGKCDQIIVQLLC